MSKTICIGDVAEYIRGITFSPEQKVTVGSQGSVVCMRTKNIQERLDESDLIAVPASCVKRREQYLQQDDILISSANSWNLVGKCVQVPKLPYTATAGGFISILRTRQYRMQPQYLYWWLSLPTTQEQVRQCAQQTTNIANLSVERFLELQLPCPPLAEQRKVVELLSRADQLRRLRRYSLEVGEGYLQAVFLEMFGDPATNSRNWPSYTLRSIATRISDGPFGSNLKTEHYVPKGTRVVRLQNIGVGEFIDQDKVFISPTHFENLRKYECFPGDVLVGTLGDPNLRACILPPLHTPVINKADCVLIRANESRALGQYVCWLLNVLGTSEHLRSLIHGQTRSRISMGQLADLEVPIPPIDRQATFAAIVESARQLRCLQLEVLRQADRLLFTLMGSSFSL